MENQQQQNATPLCRGGCGFFGSPANEGLCSKCYKDHAKKSHDSPRVPVSVPTASSHSSSVVPNIQNSLEALLISSSEVTTTLQSDEADVRQVSPSPAPTVEAPVVDLPVPKKKANRCLMCKKRVGLTGFTCRCGGLYCGEHRYDQAHNCSFDYKAMERAEIRKNNPVVVSDKIQRI